MFLHGIFSVLSFFFLSPFLSFVSSALLFLFLFSFHFLSFSSFLYFCQSVCLSVFLPSFHFWLFSLLLLHPGVEGNIEVLCIQHKYTQCPHFSVPSQWGGSWNHKTNMANKLLLYSLSLIEPNASYKIIMYFFIVIWENKQFPVYTKERSHAFNITDCRLCLLDYSTSDSNWRIVTSVTPCKEYVTWWWFSSSLKQAFV